jgi:putative ABC transport system permease protein
VRLVLNFLFENLRQGIRNLWLHRLRSLLTGLGIIFGILAVIVMVAIGEGGKAAARKQMEMLGATNVLITSVRPPESNDAGSRTQRVLDFGVKRVDADRIATIPGIERIVPMKDVEQRVVIGGTRFNANAIGTTPDLFDVVNLQLERGTIFTQIQYDAGAAVCVLGAKAAEQMFPYSDPLGQTITIGTANSGPTVVLTIIGVLQPTGLRAGQENVGIIQRDIDQDLYFPLSVARSVFGDMIARRLAGSFERKNVELTEVWIRARSIDNVEEIAGVATNVLGLPQRADVQVKAPIQILRNAERVNRIFNFVMVAIASFSLIVGGIGIMNIMLATVTERTREIGIRRALGAKQKHITLQFLIETTVISVLGGLIGIGLGIAVAKSLPIAVRQFGADNTYPTSVTTWSVVVSFIVSAAVGIGFGLYPAMKAARMDPIEALRHE